MTPRNAVLEQLNHRETRPVPYTLQAEAEVAEALTVHYGGPEWQDRLIPYVVDVASGVTTLIHEPIGSGLVRDTYGVTWRVDQRPWHLEKAPLSAPSFAGYDFPTPEVFIHPEQKEQGRESCARHLESFRTVNLGWGLFEASWGLRGFENALMDAVAEPDFYQEVLDRLAHNFLAFVDYVSDLPVDAIMFGDDWGGQSGVLMGPERWRKFLKPRWAKIYEAVHAQGKYVITHCCGSIVDILPDLIEIGLDVLESVQPEARGMNPYELKKRWGDKLTFWGCLGSQSTIPFGTPAGIAAEVERLCAEMGRGGGYILAPAKPLQPGMPVENAVAVLEAFTGQK
jgi:uroporphyrinogen decarboxylase